MILVLSLVRPCDSYGKTYDLIYGSLLKKTHLIIFTCFSTTYFDVDNVNIF